MSSQTPPAGPGSLVSPHNIDELLLYRLTRVVRGAGVVVTRLFEGRFGITRREWLLMGAVHEAQCTTASALVTRVGLDKARVSRALTSLEGRGLVVRARTACDTRSALVTLSEQGRDLYDRAFPVVARINAQLVAGLADEDLRQLDRLLRHLDARTQAMRLDQPVQERANRRRGGTKRGSEPL